MAKSSLPLVSPPPPARPAPAPTQLQIGAEAAALWQLRGCPQGCDESIWLEAEQKLQRPFSFKSDPQERAALADPRFAFNHEGGELMSELNARFPGQGGRAATSI
jgi:hypothetical protein